jgi:hypothetical protein
MGKLFGGALLGFLLGLAYCYWKQIRAVYENRDLIGSGVDAFNAGDKFIGELRKL